MVAPAGNPVRLDPWQNIVGVGWDGDENGNGNGNGSDFPRFLFAKAASNFQQSDITIDRPAILDPSNLIFAWVGGISGFPNPQLDISPPSGWVEIFQDHAMKGAFIHYTGGM